VPDIILGNVFTLEYKNDYIFKNFGNGTYILVKRYKIHKTNAYQIKSIMIYSKQRNK
jgi:hypothetical protein